MQYLQIREVPFAGDDAPTYVVEAYEDAMPPRLVASYPTLAAAVASADVEWQEFVPEDDGDAGDVLYTAKIC